MNSQQKGPLAAAQSARQKPQQGANIVPPADAANLDVMRGVQ